MQRLNLDGGPGLLDNDMALEAGTLAVSSVKGQNNGGQTHLLSIFRNTGGATSPWVADWQWHGPQAENGKPYPIHGLTDGVLA